LATVGRLPADDSSFQTRYGQFENQTSVQEFTGAVRAVNDIARKLGGPESTKRRIASDGSYLLGADPPDEVYANIVWVAMLAGNAANAIASAFESLPGLMESAGSSADERAKRAKQVLSGNGGLVSTAETVARRIEEVRGKVAPYAQPFKKASLAFQESEVLNQANQAIGGLEADLERLQKEAEQAKEKTKGWFGADKAKEQLQALTGQISETKAELERKKSLDAEMGDFFVSVSSVPPALSNLGESLKKLGKVFADAADRMSMTAKNASPAQLGDYSWLSGALNLPAETQRWKEIGTAAQSFVQGALVA
jgi:hypothetical protein